MNELYFQFYHQVIQKLLVIKLIRVKHYGSEFKAEFSQTTFDEILKVRIEIAPNQSSIYPTILKLHSHLRIFWLKMYNSWKMLIFYYKIR